MQILVATRPIAAWVGYKACYKIEFVLLLESVHNACKFEMVIILVNHSKVCVKKNIDDSDLSEALVFPKLNALRWTLHPLRLAVNEFFTWEDKVSNTHSNMLWNDNTTIDIYTFDSWC